MGAWEIRSLSLYIGEHSGETAIQAAIRGREQQIARLAGDGWEPVGEITYVGADITTQQQPQRRYPVLLLKRPLAE